MTLYISITLHRHLFCIVSRVLTWDRLLSRRSRNVCYVTAAYVIADRTTELYTCLALFSVASHVETAVIDSALHYDFILVLTSLIWDSQRSLSSICSSNTRILAFDFVVTEPRSTLILILNFSELLIRWISSYFFDANVASWVSAHCRQISYTFLRVSQFALVLFPYVNRWISSTNSSTCSFNLAFAHLSIKGALKNRKRIGDIGDPCGIPVSAGSSLLVILSRVREVSLSVRKLLVQFTISFGIPFCLRLWSRRWWETLSKAPVISSERRLATLFFLQFQTVCTASTIVSRAVFVDLFLLAFICSGGRRSLSSAQSLSLRAITVFSAFPSVLKSVIGLYDFGSE